MCGFPYQSGGPGSAGVDLVFGAADPGARAPIMPRAPPPRARTAQINPNPAPPLRAGAVRPAGTLAAGIGVGQTAGADNIIARRGGRASEGST